MAKIKRICGKGDPELKSEVNKADIEALNSDVHVPTRIRPGKDHRLLEGYHERRSDVIHKGVDFLSCSGSMHRVKVRFKPKEVVAYYVQSEHEEDEMPGRKKRRNQSGWLVPGPGKGVFYVPEDEFLRFFEFVEDEGRIIA